MGSFYRRLPLMGGVVLYIILFNVLFNPSSSTIAKAQQESISEIWGFNFVGGSDLDNDAIINVKYTSQDIRDGNIITWYIGLTTTAPMWIDTTDMDSLQNHGNNLKEFVFVIPHWHVDFLSSVENCAIVDTSNNEEIITLQSNIQCRLEKNLYGGAKIIIPIGNNNNNNNNRQQDIIDNNNNTMWNAADPITGWPNTYYNKLNSLVVFEFKMLLTEMPNSKDINYPTGCLNGYFTTKDDIYPITTRFVSYTNKYRPDDTAHKILTIDSCLFDNSIVQHIKLSTSILIDARFAMEEYNEEQCITNIIMINKLSKILINTLQQLASSSTSDNLLWNNINPQFYMNSSYCKMHEIIGGLDYIFRPPSSSSRSSSSPPYRYDDNNDEHYYNIELLSSSSPSSQSTTSSPFDIVKVPTTSGNGAASFGIYDLNDIGGTTLTMAHSIDVWSIWWDIVLNEIGNDAMNSGLWFINAIQHTPYHTRFDGIRQPWETGNDCGGLSTWTSTSCGNGEVCQVDDDCDGAYCIAQRCATFGRSAYSSGYSIIMNINNINLFLFLIISATLLLLLF